MYQPENYVELGKSLITRHVEAMMVSSGVEPGSFIVSWEHDAIFTCWKLRLLQGRSEYLIWFTDQDVLAWPRYKAMIVGTYEPRIRDVIKRSQVAVS